jgi:hypothetical protein
MGSAAFPINDSGEIVEDASSVPNTQYAFSFSGGVYTTLAIRRAVSPVLSRQALQPFAGLKRGWVIMPMYNAELERQKSTVINGVN